MAFAGKGKRRLGLKAGDWVLVRSQAEILATLDERGRLDNLPFQPEMLAYCGKRLRVYKAAHKTCDTITKTGGRRMDDAVHLENIRCDGSAHDGCEARCLIFWKEAWLMRADGPQTPAWAPAGRGCSETQLRGSVVMPGQNPSDPDPNWVCQTTALLEATRPLQWWDVRQYVLDVASGNHSLGKVLRLLGFGIFRRMLGIGIGYGVLMRAYNGLQKRRGGRPYPNAQGQIPLDQPTPTAKLDLQPGEMVQVRSAEEIRATLNVEGKNRGMWFDMEMVKYCGRTFPVDMRVTRLLDENTGKMLTMKNPCIQLKDVYCEGECTARRLGCPRLTNIYWRELWLKRT